MPTIDKKFAEELLEKVKVQKKPKVYAILNYQNRLNGDSEKMTYSGYAVCYNKKHYDSIFNSPVIGGIDILWESEKCKENRFSEDEDLLFNDWDFEDWESQ
jgi:hypothetical protein